MNKKEAIKNLGILFLICSAVYLASQVEAFQRFTTYLWVEDDTMVEEISPASYDETGGILPSSMVVVSEKGQWGIQYDSVGLKNWFAEVASSLQGALEGKGAVYSLSQEEFFLLLESPPSLYVGFQQGIPFSLLEHWVIPTDSQRLTSFFLTQVGQSVQLCYPNQGEYFAMDLPFSLAQLLSLVAEPIGSVQEFAFQREELPFLDPLMVISPMMSTTLDFHASTPTGEGQDSLLEFMGFHSQDNTQYSINQGVVFRGREDSVRMSHDGEIEYVGEESTRFYLPKKGEEITLLEQVEGCRQFTLRLLQGLDMVPEIAFLQLEEDENGIVIGFSATLSGIPLLFGDSSVIAEFWVQGEEISSFKLWYRNYSPVEGFRPILPLAQAQAISQQWGKSSIRLVYQDLGEDILSAKWVAG